MEKYYCKNCEYHTKDLDCFKEHLLSGRHKSAVPDDNRKPPEFKKKIFCCDNCSGVYLSNRALQNHSKRVHTKLSKKDIELLEKDKTIVELKEEIKEMRVYMNKSLDIAKENSNTANTSMNMLRYAKLYLNDVEPLEELTSDEIYTAIKYKNPKGTESKNETYVKTAIHRFNHGIFPDFIGDMIIEHYAPKNKSETNIISTDTSRLCFILMQKIKKGKTDKKEWINDKSGKKFTELVLKPIINAVKETLAEFIEFKQKKQLNEDVLFLMGKCVELKRDIEVDKFTKPILRYVAPYFHFDKLKFLDDDESDSDSSEDIAPIKIKVKKTKK
jgi:hypothetical protein